MKTNRVIRRKELAAAISMLLAFPAMAMVADGSSAWTLREIVAGMEATPCGQEDCAFPADG